MTSIDLSIIVPCFNEGPNIAALETKLFPVVRDLAAARMTVEVVVVDDGSHDDTAQRLHALRAEHPELVVATHARNQGIGAALRTGIRHARGSWVLTTDADGTYRFEEIPQLLALRGPDVDIVTASPYHPAGGVANVPHYRLVLSRGASQLYRLIVGGQIHTYTALFRVYRRNVLDSVPVRFDGFLAVAQLMAEGCLRGYRVAEYPTVLHVRQYGQSKAKVVRLTLAHLKYMGGLLRQRARRSTMIGSRKEPV